MTRYRFKTRWDRDFGFSPHDSLESLVFCDKISCCWVKRVPQTRGRKRGTPPKKTLFYRYCISRVNCTKMAKYRPRQPACEISSMECRFQQSKSGLFRFKEACACGCQRVVIYPLLACRACKWLQTGTAMHPSNLSLIHIWRCRRIERCRSRWSPYH